MTKIKNIPFIVIALLYSTDFLGIYGCDNWDSIMSSENGWDFETCKKIHGQTLCEEAAKRWKEPVTDVQKVMYAQEGIDREDLFRHRERTRVGLDRLLGLLNLQSQRAQIPLVMHKIAKDCPQKEGEELQRQLQNNPEFSGTLWLEKDAAYPSLKSYPPVRVEHFDQQFQENLVSGRNLERLKEDFTKGKSDLLAYEVLNQRGGVFARESDTLFPIAPLNRFFNFYASCRLDQSIRGGFSLDAPVVASSADHPALKTLIQEEYRQSKWSFFKRPHLKFLQDQQLQPYRFGGLDNGSNHGFVAIAPAAQKNSFYCYLLGGFNFFSQKNK